MKMKIATVDTPDIQKNSGVCGLEIERACEA